MARFRGGSPGEVSGRPRGLNPTSARPACLGVAAACHGRTAGVKGDRDGVAIPVAEGVSDA